MNDSTLPSELIFNPIKFSFLRKICSSAATSKSTCGSVVPIPSLPDVEPEKYMEAPNEPVITNDVPSSPVKLSILIVADCVLNVPTDDVTDDV